MSLRGIALSAGLAFIAPTLLYAADDTVPDKGRRRLTALFESAAATASEGTVRITSNKKDIALGTIVSKDGYILTKGTELLAKANKLKPSLTAELRDGSTFDIEVKGYSPATDLMLLKVDAEVLKPVEFTASKVIEPGDWVAVTGFKDRTLRGEPNTIESIAVGVLSAPARNLYMQEALVENGNRGYLGIVFEFSGDANNTRIEDIKNESAKRAGLKKGDQIVGVNEADVTSRQDIFQVMNETRPGQLLEVKIKRKVKAGDDEELTYKFNTIPYAIMDRGAMQNTMGGQLSDRRTGFPKVIQHDTRLSPKECGGPLVDHEGRVIGINIARAGRVETWALPAEVVAKSLKELQDGKHPFPKAETAVKTSTKPEAPKEKSGPSDR